MTTYSPSGAPGRLRVYVALCSLRDFTAPSWPRADFAACSHAVLVSAALSSGDAVSQLSPYFPASTSASHAFAASCALLTASPCCAQASGPIRTDAARQTPAMSFFIPDLLQAATTSLFMSDLSPAGSGRKA